ncbi:MAG: signal peptidase I, partial [Gammaproteobacteria bacterium]|nr:signal peptidase I [Gammaproteobacteria bacterium]
MRRAAGRDGEQEDPLRTRDAAEDGGRDSEPAAEAPLKSLARTAWEWCRSVLVAFALFLIIRAFLVEAFTIPTASMENTLLVGDFLVVNKAVYGAEVPGTALHLPAFAEIERRDVIVFTPPHDPGKNYVKRVVGVPGDVLQMRAKKLYLNEVQLDEPYVRHVDPRRDEFHPDMAWQADFLAHGRDPASYRPTRDNWGPIRLPEDGYFVLGDNRDNSEDSRYWGFVDKKSVRDRPRFDSAIAWVLP